MPEHRVALALMIALSSFLSRSALEQVEGSEQKLGTIISHWQARQQRFDRIFYQCVGTVTIPKGAMNSQRGLLGEDAQAKLPDEIPPENYSFEKTVSIWLDFAGNRVHKKASQQILMLDRGATFRPLYQEFLFDGERAQIYSPRARNTSATFTPYEFQPELEDRTSDSHWTAFEPGDFPIFFAAGSISTGEHNVSPANLRVAVQQDVFSWQEAITGPAGRELQVVRSRSLVPGKNAYFEAWVDMSREAAITRMELVVGGTPRQLFDIKYTEVAGAWLPSAWTITMLYDDGTIYQTESTRVARVEPDANLDHIVFHMSAGTGTVVYDEAHDTRWQLQADGTKRFIDRQPVPTAIAQDTGRRWVVAANVLVLVAGVGVAVWMWKRRRG